MSDLFLSFLLFQLSKLECLPTEQCSTESQALRRDGGKRFLRVDKRSSSAADDQEITWRIGSMQRLLEPSAHSDGQRDPDDGDGGKST